MNHVKHTKMWTKIKINLDDCLPVLSNLILSFFLWHISMTFHKTHCHTVINKKVVDRVETSCVPGPDPNLTSLTIVTPMTQCAWFPRNFKYCEYTHSGKYDVCIFLHSRLVVSYHTHNFEACFFFEIYFSWYK